MSLSESVTWSQTCPKETKKWLPCQHALHALWNCLIIITPISKKLELQNQYGSSNITIGGLGIWMEQEYQAAILSRDKLSRIIVDIIVNCTLF